MANFETAIIYVVLFVIGYYAYIIKNINLDIINQQEDKQLLHTGIKLLLLMSTFWFMLYPLNIAILYNDSNAGPAAVSSNLGYLYSFVVYINIFITFYFLLWYMKKLLEKIGR